MSPESVAEESQSVSCLRLGASVASKTGSRFATISKTTIQVYKSAIFSFRIIVIVTRIIESIRTSEHERPSHAYVLENDDDYICSDAISQTEFACGHIILPMPTNTIHGQVQLPQQQQTEYHQHPSIPATMTQLCQRRRKRSRRRKPQL